MNEANAYRHHEALSDNWVTNLGMQDRCEAMSSDIVLLMELKAQCHWNDYATSSVMAKNAS